MITIKKEENKQNIQLFLEKQNATASSENAIVMNACENQDILAIGALTYESGHVYLNHIELQDGYSHETNIALGLLKSLLNLADLRGIKTIYGSNPDMIKYYRMLRFQEEAGGDKKQYSLSLEGYFQCTHE